MSSSQLYFLASAPTSTLQILSGSVGNIIELSSPKYIGQVQGSPNTVAWPNLPSGNTTIGDVTHGLTTHAKTVIKPASAQTVENAYTLWLVQQKAKVTQNAKVVA